MPRPPGRQEGSMSGSGRWEGSEQRQPALADEGPGVPVQADVVRRSDDGLGAATGADHGRLHEEAKAVVGLGGDWRGPRR